MGAIRAQGFRVGPPAPFSAPPGWPWRWLQAIVMLALPAALALLTRRFLPITAGWAWIVFAAALLGGLALGVLRSSLVVPLGGLAAACIFPALGPVLALQVARGPGRPFGAGQIVGRAVVGMVAVSLLTLVGGLVVVGLYSRVGYLAGVGQFRGVKVSYLVPLVLLLAAVVADLPGRVEPWSRWWTRARVRTAQFFSSPVTVVEALVIAAALGAVVVALMRSGNRPLVMPSGTELQVRDLLESLLVARPRTKEFLVGHPALMLAIALSLRGRRTWLPLLGLLAAVGQVSLLNSFCHLHTPLHVTALRSFHGLWAGALVGAAAVLAWWALCDRSRRLPSP